jgi:hypothetical protein
MYANCCKNVETEVIKSISAKDKPFYNAVNLDYQDSQVCTWDESWFCDLLSSDLFHYCTNYIKNFEGGMRAFIL